MVPSTRSNNGQKTEFAPLPTFFSNHSGTAFTARVALPGEYSLDVLLPLSPGTPPHHDEAACRTRGGSHYNKLEKQLPK
ncbi:hypothetical protein TNCV_3511861 [Trichonephila clavipes]|nr:hypothetical protein TNCV_3511861 [Trichonephila clavipes]